MRIGIDKEKHALNLKENLGNIKGPFMKIAQLLSMIPDALPIEYSDQLMQLQTNAPPMGDSFVKRRMANELGINWNKNFLYFKKFIKLAAFEEDPPNPDPWGIFFFMFISKK